MQRFVTALLDGQLDPAGFRSGQPFGAQPVIVAEALRGLLERRVEDQHAVVNGVVHQLGQEQQQLVELRGLEAEARQSAVQRRMQDLLTDLVRREAQLHPPFEHAVSIVDLLFHVGPDAPEYIWGWRAATQPRAATRH